ncbi:MAG: YitT family protein [Halarsenatibacteraceae bacterium]
MRKVQQIIKRTAVVLFGIFLISSGLYLFLNSGLGLTPFTVMADGLANALGISFGQATMVINISIILGLFLLTDSKFGPGTVLNAVFIGIFLDIIIWTLGSITTEVIFFQALMLVTAILLVGAGIAIYISVDMGEGPIEALMIYIKRKTNFSLKSARISLDFSFSLIGFSMGATLGVGTIIAVAAIGPVTETIKRFIES